MKASRTFALIPAAGESMRMGRPKLLLPFQGRPLILATITAWKASRVDRVVVVIRPDDQELAKVVRPAGVEIVIPPAPPPDMKASLQEALRFVDRQYDPPATDAFLVAPADMPQLSAAIIDRLIERHSSDTAAAILAPTLGGQRGHPVLFRWSLAATVHALAGGEWLNAIVERHGALLVPCDDLIAPSGRPFADVDTPEDLERLQ